MTLSVAVIGAGVVGARRAVSAATNGRVAVVADIEISRAQALAERFGAESTDNWEAAIRHRDVEAVAVCTTNKFLLPVSAAALQASKHVLCEKPMGRNVGEASDICAVARSSDRVFKVGFTLRFHPALRAAHEACRRGDIGTLMFINATYGHGGRAGYEREWRGNAELAGGGELLDQGVHLLDLARWFAGDLEVVAAVTPRWYWEVAPLEDNALAILRTDAGQVVTMHTSWTMWKNRFTFDVFGRHGFISVNGLGGSYGPETMTIGRRTGEGVRPSEATITFDGPDSSWDDDWQDFVGAIDSGSKPEVDAADGLSVMKLVDRIYSVAGTEAQPSTHELTSR